MSDAQAAFQDIRSALLSDPCLKQYNHCLLLVLRTEFSTNGFGYVALQPGNDIESRLAMTHLMEGGKFKFMDKSSKGILHPVAFGCFRTRGKKKCLHSHLGEAFSGNYPINKCRHMCFGQCFTWVTDCYALKFVLLYDSRNSAILHLQMCFMCWDMDIEHRSNFHLVGANYWSRLGTDLCFDPLLKDYIQQADYLCKKHPLPNGLLMLPKNEPYYWPPRNPVQLKDPPAAAILQPQDIFLAHHNANKIIPFLGGGCPNVPDTGMQYLSNWPVSFGNFPLGSMATQSSVAANTTPTILQPLGHFPALIGRYMGSTVVISSHQSAPWDFRLQLSLHLTTTCTAVLSLQSYLPALAQFLVGVVLFWTMSKQVESH